MRLARAISRAPETDPALDCCCRRLSPRPLQRDLSSPGAPNFMAPRTLPFRPRISSSPPPRFCSTYRARATASRSLGRRAIGCSCSSGPGVSTIQPGSAAGAGATMSFPIASTLLVIYARMEQCQAIPLRMPLIARSRWTSTSFREAFIEFEPPLSGNMDTYTRAVARPAQQPPAEGRRDACAWSARRDNGGGWRPACPALPLCRDDSRHGSGVRNSFDRRRRGNCERPSDETFATP